MSTAAVAEILAVLAAVADAVPSVRKVERYDGADPTPRRQMPKGPGECGSVVIDYAGSTEAGFTEDETYGLDGGAGDVWLETATHTFTVTVVVDSQRVTDVLTIWNGIRDGLRDLGPSLGLEYVERWGPVTTASRIADGRETEAHGRERRILVASIPVQIALDGQDE